MRIDVRQTIAGYDGQPILGGDGKPDQLRSYISTALNNTLPGEVMTPEVKNKAYELTIRVYANNELQLTSDQAALIKERVGLLYGPLVVGRIADILDGNDEREAPLPPEATAPAAPVTGTTAAIADQVGKPADEVDPPAPDAPVDGAEPALEPKA